MELTPVSTVSGCGLGVYVGCWLRSFAVFARLVLAPAVLLLSSCAHSALGSRVEPDVFGPPTAPFASVTPDARRARLESILPPALCAQVAGTDPWSECLQAGHRVGVLMRCRWSDDGAPGRFGVEHGPSPAAFSWAPVIEAPFGLSRRTVGHAAMRLRAEADLRLLLPADGIIELSEPADVAHLPAPPDDGPWNLVAALDAVAWLELSGGAEWVRAAVALRVLRVSVSRPSNSRPSIRCCGLLFADIGRGHAELPQHESTAEFRESVANRCIQQAVDHAFADGPAVGLLTRARMRRPWCDVERSERLHELDRLIGVSQESLVALGASGERSEPMISVSRVNWADGDGYVFGALRRDDIPWATRRAPPDQKLIASEGARLRGEGDVTERVDAAIDQIRDAIARDPLVVECLRSGRVCGLDAAKQFGSITGDELANALWAFDRGGSR